MPLSPEWNASQAPQFHHLEDFNRDLLQARRDEKPALELSGEAAERRYSVSRAQHDAQIYTNDRSKLPRSLSRENSQRTATEVDQSLAPRMEPTSARTERPGEQEQGHSLGMGL
jgi:hypothetical protein